MTRQRTQTRLQAIEQALTIQRDYLANCDLPAARNGRDPIGLREFDAHLQRVQVTVEGLELLLAVEGVAA